MKEKGFVMNPLQENGQIHNQLWEKCLEMIRNSMTRRKFENSFALVKFQSFDKGELILNVPNYVLALPIHESQREVEKEEDWSVFEYYLEPCYNFYQQLLWHREKQEVLEPERVRNEMKEIIKKMLEAY